MLMMIRGISMFVGLPVEEMFVILVLTGKGKKLRRRQEQLIGKNRCEL